jgi:magnesium transporter
VADEPRFRILAFDAEGQRVVDDPDEISDLVAEEGTVVWADLSDATAAELDLVQREFSLHPLAIEDASKHGQRPKLEHFYTHAFVVAYAADAKTRELVEVDLFVGENWLISVHDRAPLGGTFVVDDCQTRVSRMHPAQPTASFVFYVVLDAIVDTYFSLIDVLGEEVDEVEERVFDDPNPEVDQMQIQRDMLDLRKRLLTVRRRIVPLREVLLVLLREDLPWMTRDTRQYLQDVFDHVMRVTDEIDVRRELIGNAVDAHLAMASNHMNRIMKRMTSWGAILIAATLIAGIYGMNFDQMPELRWPLGYPFALALMAGVTTVLLLYFRRRDWL